MFSDAEIEASYKEKLLLKTPVIELARDVGANMYKQVGQSVSFLKGRGSPDIEVVINSGGGEVDAGLDIYDFLRLYPGKKHGLVVGRAASMAAVILQACTTRACATHAGILIHHISRRNVSLDELRHKRKLDKVRASMEKSQEKLYQILSARTGQSIQRIRKVCAEDKYMTAAEALSFGLVDEIV